MVMQSEGISSVGKMHYFKTSLTEVAVRIKSNLPFSRNSFESAWNTLVSRCDNNRLLISAHLDPLMATSVISSRSAENVNSLFTTTTEALNALSGLNAPVDQWHHLLVHYITRRLDTHTRKGWEVKLGSTTDPPTYNQNSGLSQWNSSCSGEHLELLSSSKEQFISNL